MRRDLARPARPTQAAHPIRRSLPPSPCPHVPASPCHRSIAFVTHERTVTAGKQQGSHFSAGQPVVKLPRRVAAPRFYCCGKFTAWPTTNAKPLFGWMMSCGISRYDHGFPLGIVDAASHHHPTASVARGPPSRSPHTTSAEFKIRGRKFKIRGRKSLHSSVRRFSEPRKEGSLSSHPLIGRNVS